MKKCLKTDYVNKKKQAFFKEKLSETIGKPNNYGNLLCN